MKSANYTKDARYENYHLRMAPNRECCAMTSSIRDAAQALVDACDRSPTTVQLIAGIEGLRAALSAPQPTADERVAELMRLVRECLPDGWVDKYGDLAAVEKSARALLSASRDDAEHAAMYRWLRDGAHGLYITTGDLAGDGDEVLVPAGLAGEVADKAIRSAMKETK